MMQVELVQREQALVGEGPVWLPDERVLLWLDIKGQRLFRHDPATGAARSWGLADRVGAVIPRTRGGYVLLAKRGVFTSDVPFEALVPECHPDGDLPDNRFNDAKCDPEGRLWAGSMDDNETKASGRLYRFDSLASPVRVRSDVNLSNGLGWSPDGRVMYFVETLRHVIWAHDYDVSTGEAGPPRIFADVPAVDGYPDGLCVDADGCVWLAHWGGARLTRFTPQGRVDRVVKLPVPQVASCAFGGAALDTLYVTTAAAGMDARALADAPLSGSLFAFQPGVKGVPVAAFRG
jgi:sugar lactone lactonase YvrE